MVPIIETFLKVPQYQDLYDAKCPLYPLDEIFNSTQQNFFFAEERADLIVESLHEPERLELLQNVDEVFNSLLIANNNNNQYESQQFNENYILSVTENSLMYLSESIFNDGLVEFMKHKHLLCRNLYLNYKMFFWFFDTNTKFDYIDEYKLLLGQGLKAFFNVSEILRRASAPNNTNACNDGSANASSGSLESTFH